MSRLISEPLAYHATKEFVGPLSIINAPGDALAIAEIKLSQIAVKMSFSCNADIHPSYHV